MESLNLDSEALLLTTRNTGCKMLSEFVDLAVLANKRKKMAEPKGREREAASTVYHNQCNSVSNETRWRQIFSFTLKLNNIADNHADNSGLEL